MKKLLLVLVGAAVMTGGAVTKAQARDRDHDGREDSIENRQQHLANLRVKRRSREIYVLERDRPVRRSVFIDERGRYYNEYGDRRVYVTRYFNSYPERYYYRNGHRRVGFSIHFD